jgi:uncharacterized YigZ family protein
VENPERETPSRATGYTTLAPGADFRHELVIKRSRFITVLRRAEDEDAARALVTELRKEFYDARHHCTAFVLGPDQSVRRSNDDGEPSGTAGIPMLDALAKHRTSDGGALSDVAAVVVRYFGGILLGAGGLVRAYSESVSAALEAAPLVQRRRLGLFTVSLPHAAAGRLENELRSAGYTMTGNGYDALQTRIGLAMPDEPGVVDAARHRLASLTAGGIELEAAGTDWVDLPG